ncbi:MAG: hypothetical protein JWO94_444 [Verrucomicrobiaceae bacterium]|nr:hypothetical protein [Verrucomicrobiaceae bacterium]
MTSIYKSFSPARIWALTMSTVTQLLRMRILVFLLVISVVVAATSFAFPTFNAAQQLKMLKDVCFGLEQLFAYVIAMVATALLLPKDVEDRTLYTILAKPVPRVDYLLGKLFGVLVVVAGGLLVLDIVLSGVLWLKQGYVLEDTLGGLRQQLGGTPPPEAIASATADVARQGLTWALHVGVLAIFLKAAVLASLTLLISCIATSTLFTVITSFCFFILGHGETLFREYFFKGGTAWWQYLAAATLSIFCPDLSLFDVVDAVAEGKTMLLSDALHMAGIGLLYTGGYTVVAYLVFVEKEL